jgi:type IV secretory pathway TraG/TraD family ATPase VirD4
MFPNADTIDFHSIRDIPVETLFSHTLVTGTTGSGKSRTVLRPLLRSLLSLRAADPQVKAGALILDPKSDLLPMVQGALQQCGRRDDLIVIGPGADERPWNPLATQLSPVQTANMILAAASTMGQESTNRARAGERFWELQDRALLTALVALSRQALAAEGSGESLTFQHLHQCRELLTQPESQLRQWAAQLAVEIDFAESITFLEIAALPDTTRTCIVASIGSLLQPFVCDPLRAVLQPAPNRSPVDLRNIFEQGKIVVINTGFAENALELLPAQVMIKTAFARLALSRTRWAKNVSRPCWLFVDEGARCYTAHADSEASETNLMDMARSNRVGVIWCAQNLSALLSLGNEHLVNKLGALAATHIFLANTCPATAALAARSLGTETQHHLHRAVGKSLPPPLLFPRDGERAPESDLGVMVPYEAPILPASKLARLKPGEMWLRLGHSGEIHHLQADVVAP